MTKILYPELSYKITGLCFKTHKDLGRFCREIQYADKLESLLKESGIEYKREYKLTNLQPDSPKGNRADFLIGGRIILDTKAKKFITKEDYIQMQRYLRAANLELGMIVNFRSTFLKPKRVLNSGYRDFNSDPNDPNNHPNDPNTYLDDYSDHSDEFVVSDRY